MDKYPLIRFVSFHSPLLLSLLAPSDMHDSYFLKSCGHCREAV